jgi:hypothetical protein
MDLPENGDLYKQKLQKGDMVLLYVSSMPCDDTRPRSDVLLPQTDGLADNVHNSQILALLKHVDATLATPTNAFLLPAEKALERARLLADVLVGYARLCMSRQDVVSPFERELHGACGGRVILNQRSDCRGRGQGGNSIPRRKDRRVSRSSSWGPVY